MSLNQIISKSMMAFCCIWVLVACSSRPTLNQRDLAGAVVPTRVVPTTVTPSIDAQVLASIIPYETEEMLELNRSVQGSLTLDGWATVYRFEGLAGQLINATMDTLSNDLDPFLILLDSQGREITRNDDWGTDNRNAGLRDILLNDDGQYYLVATRYRQMFGTTSGDFSLLVKESPGGNIPTPLTRRISYGLPVQGRISNEEYSIHYAFKGNMGDQISVLLSSEGSELDPTLRLSDALGNEIAFNDDIHSVQNLNASIENFILPYTGYYTVTATRYEGRKGESVGNYTLEVILKEEGVLDRFAYLNHDLSKTITADANIGFLNSGYDVGDRFFGEQEVSIQTVLTFQLPITTTETPVKQAWLNFRNCSWEGLGLNTDLEVAVWVTQFETLTSLPFQPSNTDSKVTAFTECQPIDVTEYVQQAENQIQFRIVASDMPINGTDNTLILNAPTLLLELE